MVEQPFDVRRWACVKIHGGHYWPFQVFNCLGCGLSYTKVNVDGGEPYVMEETSRTVVTPSGEAIRSKTIPQPYTLPDWLHYDR